jgi:dolichol kinase
LNSLPTVEEHYHVEFIRKGIHFCSLSIPVVYYFIEKSTALTILVPLTSAFLIVDIARYYHAPTSAWFYSTFGWLLRSREQDARRKSLNGATYILLSAILCIVVFPKLITVTAFAILIISDSVAALVGRKFGKRPLFKKTAEGTMAFFLSAVVVVLLAPKVENQLGEYIIGILGGAVGAIVEAMSIRVDDNLSIPVSIGITMWVLYTFFYPTLHLSSTPLLP